MTPFKTPGRARLVGLSVLAATFLAGAGVGAAVNQAASIQDAQAESARQERRDDDDRGGRTDMFDQLSLSPEQRARVDTIMARKRSELDAFWDTAGPRIRGITASAHAEIRAVLTPAQQVEYDRLRAKHDRHDHDDRDEELDR